MRVTEVRVTPVAVLDPPLLNAVGVHEPYALRSIIEIETDDGITGIGETYGDSAMLSDLEGARDAVIGLDPFALNQLEARLAGKGTTSGPAMSLAPGTVPERAQARLLAALETPFLDIQGKMLNRPVCDLLGGRVRDEVPFAAYLFFRYASHIDFDGYPPDGMGEVLTPHSMVEEARHFIETYGFRSIKLKGGVLPPGEEIATLQALRDAFPDHPMRIDPNAAWSVETSKWVAQELEGTLQYLEDPAEGIEGMAEVARHTTIPLATNMAVTGFEHLPAAVANDACQIILADHHYWGGLQRSRELAQICAVWGLDLGMHSNSHLGVSLAAMVHFGAAMPAMPYAYDTHQPWQTEDEVILGGKLPIVEGSVAVPDGPGLGVELDPEAVGQLHDRYQTCGIRERDDVAQMRRYDPHWTGRTPRF